MKKFLVLSLLIPTISFAQSKDYFPDTKSSDQRVDNIYDDHGAKEFSVTPSVRLLDFPHPLEGAIELNFNESFGIKYSKSFEPKIDIEDSRAKLDNQSIELRAYPNQSAWFVGVAYGEHEVSARRTETVNGFETNIYGVVKSEYLTPVTGWKWIYDSGFTVALQLGWIFPFNSSARVTSDQDSNPLVATSSEYQEYRQDVEDAARKFVSSGVPNLGLLEVGWTF